MGQELTWAGNVVCSGSLPETGASSGVIAIVAVAAIVAGVVLVRVASHRRAVLSVVLALTFAAVGLMVSSRDASAQGTVNCPPVSTTTVPKPSTSTPATSTSTGQSSTTAVTSTTVVATSTTVILPPFPTSSTSTTTTTTFPPAL